MGGQNTDSCNISAYIVVYFSNFHPEKAFRRCGVVRVSKMRFSFICKIFQLKMLIIVRITTYLHSIRAATVTVAKNRIQSTYIWPFSIRTRSNLNQVTEAALRLCFNFSCVTEANSLFSSAFVSNAADQSINQ